MGDSFGRIIVERFALLNFWTAALLAGALLLDRALSRRARASLRIALYAPVALRILLPLDWNIGMAGGPEAATLLAPVLQIGASSGVEHASGHRPAWYAFAGAIYAAIAMLLAVRAIVARVRLARLVAGAEPIAAALHPGVPCPMVAHDDLGPMTVGLYAPRIVLPRRLLVAGEERALACVLRHETAHVLRRDAWLSSGMQLLAATSWPVAALWIATARVRQLMELACDEAALAGADATERRHYGHTLLDMAEWRSLAIAPLGAGELHFGSTLRARIEAMVSQRHWPLVVQTVALSVASVGLFIACGGSAPPRAAPDAKGYGYEFAPDTKKEFIAAEPSLDSPRTNEDGRMSPERIQSKVRGRFDAFSTCYEAGQNRDPNLSGVVTVRWVIGEDGLPLDVAEERSSLPDQEVVSCVLGVFRSLRFDESHLGKVTIVYPIAFAP